MVSSELIKGFARQIWRNQFFQLFMATAMGSMSVYVQLSTSISEEFLGEDKRRGLLYWLLLVPLQVCSLVYFVRFLGSFLITSWVRDIAKNDGVRTGLAAMMGSILLHNEVLQVFHSEKMISSITHLLVEIVHGPEVHDAVKDLVFKTVQSEKLVQSMQDLLSRESLADSVVTQLVNVMENEKIPAATGDFAKAVLSRHDVQSAALLRLQSVMRKSEVYEASFVGMSAAAKHGAKSALGFCACDGFVDAEEGV
mmetsp:Transcript_88188/g.156352  ORF Transcript_88188/g.156352 Transcript_88188/m.156352 type:complete len:253 (+) Transcript_88188:75-833(+)